MRTAVPENESWSWVREGLAGARGPAREEP